MSRFVTLPSGERVNLALVERITVEELRSGRHALSFRFASGHTSPAGTYDTREGAHRAADGMLAGDPTLFDTQVTIVPSSEAIGERVVESIQAMTRHYGNGWAS